MPSYTFTPSILRGAGTRAVPEIPAGSSFTNNFSLDFDGTNDKVTFSDIVASGEFTLSFWMKPKSFFHNTNVFPFGQESGAANYFMILNTNDDGGTSTRKLLLRIDSSQTKVEETSGNNVVLNQWNNIVIVRDSSNNIQFFRNGATFGSSYSESNTLTLNSIGRVINSSYGFQGGMDEFAVWNSNQTSNVSTIYSEGLPSDLSSLSPLHWYRFEEGSGTTATDSGTGGNNGTINGATYSTSTPS